MRHAAFGEHAIRWSGHQLIGGVKDGLPSIWKQCSPCAMVLAVVGFASTSGNGETVFARPVAVEFETEEAPVFFGGRQARWPRRHLQKTPSLGGPSR